MPLRAILNNKTIQSYNLTKMEWLELKKIYKSQRLTMPCCDRDAVPKTSKLGTQYFAHIKRGECTSAPETEQHRHLKGIVAKISNKNGWDTYTEYEGTTPSGEKWIADIFCQKGKSKMAFEIQWSPQCEDEYRRRSKKYQESGVRCLWLTKLSKNKKYKPEDLIEEDTLPCFGFKECAENSFIIPIYEVSIEEFITGIFNKRLRWDGPSNTLYSVYVHYTHDIQCYHCKNTSNAITQMKIKDSDGNKVNSYSLSFSEEKVCTWILKNLDQKTLKENSLGRIKFRYSEQEKMKYISNGCSHCDEIIENEDLTIYKDFSDKSCIKIECGSDLPDLPIIPASPGWEFKGYRGRIEY